MSDAIALAAVRYLAFVLLAVLGPGVVVQRLLRVPIDRGLVLPLGIAFTAGLHWLSLVAELPWLFPSVCLALDLWLVRARWTWAPGPSLRGALPAAVGLMAFLALTQYGENRSTSGAGFAFERLYEEDTTFHVGLVWELSHTYPPQVPGASGFTLAYHVGLELLQAASVRWAAVSPYDSLSRFDVTLVGLALLLALRAAAHALGGSPLAVAIAPWMLLASGGAFLFGLPDLGHWTGLLDDSFVFELAYASSVVPAVALALGMVVALRRHEAGEGRGWLALAAILGFAAPFFKVFIGPQLLLGLGVAAVLRGPRPLVLPALGAALGTLALMRNTTSAHVAVSLAASLPAIRPYLGLPPLDGPGLALWTGGWILACYGLRLLALPELWRRVWDASRAAAALAVVAFSGWPLALLFEIVFVDENRFRSVVNHSHYFLEQSSPLLWLFTALAIGRLRLKGRTAVLAALLGAVLAVPGTTAFVVKKRAGTQIPVSPEFVEGMRALQADSRPGDVVIERPGARRYPPPALVLAGRRVPYAGTITYLAHVVPRPALDERLLQVRRFFETGDVGEAAAIARALGASHLCLYGSDTVRFSPDRLLRPVYVRPNVRVYGILRAAD